MCRAVLTGSEVRLAAVVIFLFVSQPQRTAEHTNISLSLLF